MDNDITDKEHYRRQAEHLQERVQELEQSLVAAKRRPLPSTFDAMMCMMGTMEALCAHLGVHPGALKAFIDARYESLELLPPDQRQPEPTDEQVRNCRFDMKTGEPIFPPDQRGEPEVAGSQTGRSVGTGEGNITELNMPNPFTDLPHGGGA